MSKDSIVLAEILALVDVHNVGLTVDDLSTCISKLIWNHKVSSDREYALMQSWNELAKILEVNPPHDYNVIDAVKKLKLSLSTQSNEGYWYKENIEMYRVLKSVDRELAELKLAIKRDSNEEIIQKICSIFKNKPTKECIVERVQDLHDGLLTFLEGTEDPIVVSAFKKKD